MSAVFSALLTGVTVIVFLIAVFSLFVAATIPVGRFVERRRARSQVSGIDSEH